MKKYEGLEVWARWS